MYFQLRWKQTWVINRPDRTQSIDRKSDKYMDYQQDYLRNQTASMSYSLVNLINNGFIKEGIETNLLS